MARSTPKRFDQATEIQMQNFYGTLGEKNQRRYVALQSRQLGPGGSSINRDAQFHATGNDLDRLENHGQ